MLKVRGETSAYSFATARALCRGGAVVGDQAGEDVEPSVEPSLTSAEV
jgi:hypothetical protein